MNKSQHIIDELKSLQSPLADIGTNCNVFTAPEGYFDVLPVELLARLQSATEAAPEGYFDGLSTSIWQKIEAEGKEKQGAIDIEENENSEVINNIGRKNVFSVPTGYFENLPSNILATATSRLAPIVQMKRSPLIVRYMIAAAFTGLVGFSLFTMFNKRAQNKDAVNATVMATANDILKNNSFDETLASLSAADIEQYLENRGQNPDDAVVASSINDDDLPDALDYMINENTLNNFLTNKAAN